MTIEEILAALQAIVDEAKASEGGELNDEQVARYEALEGQLKRARKTEEIQLRNAAYNTPVRSTPALHTGSSGKDDTLERAFNHYLRTGQANSDLTELRAQSEGTATAGGYLVPDGFRDKLVERLVKFGGVAEVAETISTSTGNPLEWPTIDDTANVGAITAEGAVFATGADLVFGTAVLGAYKYTATGADAASSLRVSVELLQDAAFDVESLVTKMLGKRIGRIQAQHLVNGTGSAQPKGIVNGKTGIQTALNTGVISYGDLLKFVHSVDPEYRDNAKWLFNDTTLAQFQGVLDSTGRPILTDQNRGIEGKPGGQTLLGYPVVIDQAFSNVTAGSATVNWGAFGDFSEGYVIRRVKDIVVNVNPYARMNYGQVEFSAWARMDAVPQNPNAYIALTNKV